MKAIFVFVLSLVSLFLQSQDLEVLKPKKIRSNSGNTFLLVKDSQSDVPIVRRLNTNSVIVRAYHLDEKYSYSEVYEINDLWKLSDEKNYKKSKKFYIKSSKSLSEIEGLKEIYFDERRKISLIETNSRVIKRRILPLPYVTYVQGADRIPIEESLIRDHNLSINGIRSGQAKIENIEFEVRVISVKEGSLDTLDLDIGHKSTRDELSSPQVTSHATDMATLIGGTANSGKAGQGVSTSSLLYSESFNSLLPALDADYLDRGISIQNHSYGVGIENFYGVESVAFDEQTIEMPELLHVFSAGNSGSSNSTGDYSDILRYRTLTGSFKQAKNVLVVTGTDDEGNVPESNSAGPAYDGRIKPELAAYGGGGTSDAAALVSGAAAGISQYFENSFDQVPTSDMVKAILIASAIDIEAEGPDFTSGYGQLNYRRSLELIDEGNFLTGTLSDQNSSENHLITIPPNTVELRVTLTWRDPAANNGDFYALVNDLDLEVTGMDGQWLPWVLDHRPSVDQLESPAVRKIDTLNNVELITIENPNAGEYTLTIASSDLIGDQPFSVAYLIQAEGDFTWDYPTRNDAQLIDEPFKVYFDHSFQENGNLEIGYLDETWTTVDGLSPSQMTSILQESGGPKEAVLRATFGMNEFKSDTFAIHEKLEMDVALLCDDELVLTWNKIGENQDYELLAFDGTQLQPIISTADTFAIVDRSSYEGVHFTARPVFEFTNGRPDETVNVSQQGIGCYLNNFLISVREDKVEMNVDISLPDRINTLRILKTDSRDSAALVEINPSELDYLFEDADLNPGRSTYQLQLITENGLEILSERIEIFTTDDKKYILFPNPVTDGQLAFLSPVTGAVFQILDTSGKPLTDFIISAEFEVFPISLSKGVYLYRVIKDGKTVESGRFAVGS